MRKIRHQFSRPIGSFQAIKHKLADLLLLVEMGRSAIDRALLVEQDPTRLAEAAAVAQIWCSDAFTTVSTENVHIHGGIGFTWEHDAHLYFRRARADEELLGDAKLTEHPAPVAVKPALLAALIVDLLGTDVVFGPLVQRTAQRVLDPAHDGPSTSAGRTRRRREEGRPAPQLAALTLVGI